MLTLFTLPKPFSGHIGTIQTNAIRSWKRLGSDVQVILCGKEPGLAEAAQNEGVEVITDIARNEFGTPLLNDAFAKARATARHNLMLYTNADIIFVSDLRRTVEQVRLKSFLMVGQRINLDLNELWDFESLDWERKLRQKVQVQGELFSFCGLDYFLFPKNAPFAQLPPFAVGRPGWDNWFVGHCRRGTTCPLLTRPMPLRPFTKTMDMGI